MPDAEAWMTEMDTWMTAAVDFSGEVDPDSIHLDYLSPRFRERETWEGAMSEVVFAADELRRRKGWRLAVAVGMSMEPTVSPAGLAPATIGALIDTIAHVAPPNLFLFPPGSEPWSHPTIQFSRWWESTRRGKVMVVLGEWFNADDTEFQRAFWITPPDDDDPVG